MKIYPNVEFSVFRPLIHPNHTADSVYAGQQFHMRCVALVDDSVSQDNIEIAWYRQDGNALIEVQTDISQGCV